MKAMTKIPTVFVMERSDGGASLDLWVTPCFRTYTAHEGKQENPGVVALVGESGLCAFCTSFPANSPTTRRAPPAVGGEKTDHHETVHDGGGKTVDAKEGSYGEVGGKSVQKREMQEFSRRMNWISFSSDCSPVKSWDWRAMNWHKNSWESGMAETPTSRFSFQFVTFSSLL